MKNPHIFNAHYPGGIVQAECGRLLRCAHARVVADLQSDVWDIFCPDCLAAHNQRAAAPSDKPLEIVTGTALRQQSLAA